MKIIIKPKLISSPIRSVSNVVETSNFLWYLYIAGKNKEKKTICYVIIKL